MPALPLPDETPPAMPDAETDLVNCPDAFDGGGLAEPAGPFACAPFC
jgi:hypothetical protein